MKKNRWKQKVFLYLDDDRIIKAPDGYKLIIVRSFSSFKAFIKFERFPDAVSFDHDLANEHTSDYLSDENILLKDGEISLKYDEYKEKTGYDAALFLVEYVIEHNLKMPQCFVHSMNPVGSKNISSYLNNYSRIHEDYECCVDVNSKYYL